MFGTLLHESLTLATKFKKMAKFQIIRRLYSKISSEQTAGIIVIGNEILNSRVTDLNSHFISRLMYKSGVNVKKISVVEDKSNIIADEINYFSKNFNYVITTGGIGPTHDDVTFEGIAEAFDQNLKYESVLVDIIKDKFHIIDLKSPLFKMALIPENSSLHFGVNKKTGEKLNYPCIQVKNVFVFPGSPYFLQTSFGSLYEKLFGTNTSFQATELYIDATEATFADALTAVSKEFPTVKFGSYPQNNRSCYKALVTLESNDINEMNKAKAKFESMIPSRIIIDQNEIPWKIILLKYKNFSKDCKNYHLYHNTLTELRRKYLKPEKVVIYVDGEPESMVLLQLAHIVTSCDVSNNSKLKIIYPNKDNVMTKKIDELTQKFKAQAIPFNESSIQEAMRRLETDPNIEVILLSSFSDTAEIFNRKVHCPLKNWTTADVDHFIQSF